MNLWNNVLGKICIQQVKTVHCETLIFKTLGQLHSNIQFYVNWLCCVDFRHDEWIINY